MKEKIIIPKIYTRDFAVSICQFWARRYLNFLGKEVNLAPGNVYIFHDGLVDVYRNARTKEVVNEIYLNALEEDKNFHSDFYQRSLGNIERLNQYLDQQYLDRKKLIEFTNFMYDFFEVLYPSLFISVDLSFPNKFREDCMDLRTRTEKLEYLAFGLITNSLKKIYPQYIEHIKYITLEELRDNEISLQTLEKRASSIFYLVDTQILDENGFQKLKAELNFDVEAFNNLEGEKELKGQIAFKGNVTGKAKIVSKKEDMTKVEDGDILISPMTIPDFLPAMQRAAAFVTDEGGITCHAAIVAREMKTPCIIGTKIATKVLKDGDLVEVDAEKGIVKIINR